MSRTDNTHLRCIRDDFHDNGLQRLLVHGVMVDDDTHSFPLDLHAVTELIGDYWYSNQGNVEVDGFFDGLKTALRYEGFHFGMSYTRKEVRVEIEH